MDNLLDDILEGMEQPLTPEPGSQIECPHCGGDSRLQFTPLTYAVWVQCRCGYGWDMAYSGASKEVN